MPAIDTNSATRRTRRRAHVRRRLGHKLVQAIRGTDDIDLIGEDLLFGHLASSQGVDESHYLAKQVLTPRGPVTLLVVMNSAWYDPESMAPIRAAQRSFAYCGSALAILPERAIEAMASAIGRIDLPRLIEASRKPTSDHLGQDDLPCHSHTLHDPGGCRAVVAATGRDCLG